MNDQVDDPRFLDFLRNFLNHGLDLPKQPPAPEQHKISAICGSLDGLALADSAAVVAHPSD